ncbi:MAG: LPS-assembly protein LptD [Gammaproteobacteria bacterium]
MAEDSQWRQCGRQPSKHKITSPSSPDLVTDDSRRVHLFRIDQDVHADRVQYSEKGKKAVATGNVLLRDPDLDITSERVDYWTEDETAKAENVRYWYHPSHGSGTADKAERVSQDVVKLENATYSSCDFEDRDWELKAAKATLDREKSVGTARNVTAKFKGVPFFYTPWMSFPLNNERKTGLLAPVFGRSSNSGIDIETPFYWNIAPHRDALFTPRYLSKRGVQLGGKGRYLNDNNYGELNLQYLDDRNFDDDRYLASFKHEHKNLFGENIRAFLLYNKVSDDDYFEDLGDSIGVTSTQQLERRGDLSYSGSHLGGSWGGLVRLQQFQIVDSDRLSSSDPYKLLPQIHLSNSFTNLPAGFEFSSANHWTAFEHDDRIEGDRLHLSTEISRPWTTPGFFITPSMRFMHTSYDLSSTDNHNSPTRTLPSFSLDSGLIFERDIANSHTRHTLEPRLYYLYTPERDQSDIPLFDTGEYEFSFAQLFRSNRFTGSDRIADANQLTAALTTRFINQHTGNELLRASLGQIFYFRDRDVMLRNTEDDDDSYSNLAGELQISISDRWEAISAALWDPQEDEFNRTNVRLQYRSANNFIFNIGHRFRREDFSQSDISFIYPINEQWRAVGRWNYDFKENRDLDLLGGLEYDTCCWKISFAARRFTNDSEGDYNNSIEVQLTLKGLTSLGSPLTDQLQRNIRGYEDRNTFKY